MSTKKIINENNLKLQELIRYQHVMPEQIFWYSMNHQRTFFLKGIHFYLIK